MRKLFNNLARVNVITLNCYGVQFYPLEGDFYKDQRLAAIANYFDRHKDEFDIIFLQEVFLDKDQEMIAEVTKRSFPFSSGFAGRLAS